MNRFLLICFSLTILACNKSYTPKPSGYPRIDFPKKSTFLSESHCPFTFQQPDYTTLNFHDEDKFWFDLKFEPLGGTLHMSYKSLNNDVYSFTEDSRDLAYKHAQKAEAISEQLFVNDSLDVYGVVYTFQGGTATPIQFYLTDSTNHFVRGALYFNTALNDSIIPISIFIKEDIYSIIESWRWE